MPTVHVELPGNLQTVALSTAELAITIDQYVTSGIGGPLSRYFTAVQLSCSAAWSYASVAGGPYTAVAALTTITLPVSGPLTFYAKAVSATPNLEILTVR